ncbi:MAG: GrpB family protein [Candidatus Latescibacteria bacterium]|nr:GrpB family protein [Candidatus Latescibacterota bacterium]MBT4138767.1 GrpB family protein [Candidatus Latescibacterota bacterium]MBT5830073.1 GrpB family protein [Candidatus Latescibacterota bacterium]
MRKISVVDYDPTWPVTFEHLRSNIWPTISDIATTIEHIGSTSVVGLSAKPIIDMTIVVPNISQMPTLIDRLYTINYTHQGDQGVPGREAFKRQESTPAHHLYACEKNNLGFRNHLAIRDYMKQHPEAVQAYGDLKKQLAAQFPSDIDAYVDGKTDFLLNILTKAGFTEKELQEIQSLNSIPPKRLDLKFLYHFSCASSDVLEVKIQDLKEGTPVGKLFHWLHYDRTTKTFQKLTFKSMGSEEGKNHRVFEQGELHFDTSQANLQLETDTISEEFTLDVNDVQAVPNELISQVQYFLQRLETL